jgi:hypothetical protein
MSENIKVKKIRLAHHSREDKIVITHVEKPYGEYSDPIVKIDVKELGKNMGSLEIPYENLDDVINALRKAKEVCKKIPHEDVHAELNAEVGGGQ